MTEERIYSQAELNEAVTKAICDMTKVLEKKTLISEGSKNKRMESGVSGMRTMRMVVNFTVLFVIILWKQVSEQTSALIAVLI